MKIFNCEELSNLVKKVVDKKLIDECADAFVEKASGTFHFLSYDEMIEVCVVLDEYTSICNIRPREKYNTLYCFVNSIYEKDDFMAIAGEAFYISDNDYSACAFKVLFIDECDEDDDWHPIFLIREFWEFCENFINRNEKEDEGKEKENKGNVNNKTTEIEEETLSIQDIYKIITDSEGFEKIIEGMKDIDFTDETIYEVILNLVKRLN